MDKSTDKKEKQEDGGQAFPIAGFDGPDCWYQGEYGMSLRDYFAAAALTGFIGSSSPNIHDLPSEVLAQNAWIMADWMLWVREGKGDK